MDSIYVVQDCKSSTPGLGEVEFFAGQEVNVSDPNYYPLLWAGLAIAPPVGQALEPSTDDISNSLKAARDQAKESE